ncbi:MAG: hypothetical protein GVY33_16260 [Alphaproteobacteria bacterium]|jgi:hypothetical protein|nr:hypothetical protein [Alphaproteobacteria bacterium]
MPLIEDALAWAKWALGGTFETRGVLKSNGRTLKRFQGHIIGSFRSTGANAWDPFVFEAEDGGLIDVFAGIEVQVEDRGARFRMRAKGRVVEVVWAPAPADGLADADAATRRAVFLERYVERFDNKDGMGAKAFIAKTLLRR